MANKEIIKSIIIEGQEFIATVKPICRDYEIEENANYVFTGSRRTGKTWFMYDLIHRKTGAELNFQEILYINFEDERFLGFTSDDFNLLIESYKELFEHKPVLYLDEIHNIEEWEKFARRLADSDYRVYITGSNAKMLSREIQSTLGGRFMVKEITPLSFVEYLRFNEIVPDKNVLYTEERFAIKKQFDTYFYYGGFPETLKFKNRREYLSNLYQKVLYGDIITRNKIKNDFALKFLIKKLSESIHDESSFTRIKNLITATGIKMGTTTVIEYIGYLKDAFLISTVTNFFANISGRESKKKYYFVDNGILNLFLISPETALLENLVFNHLYRNYDGEIFYLRNSFEIDFYLQEKDEIIQVCYSLDDTATRERELNSIKKAMVKSDIHHAKIITMDQKEQIEFEGKTIEVIPVWHWLLEG